MNENKVVLVRRDTLEKILVSIDEVTYKVKELLNDIQINLLNEAKSRLQNNIKIASNYEEFKSFIEKGHLVLTKFDGNGEDEDKIKEETGLQLIVFHSILI
ncbi:proline--tRNA ligase [Mycoplasmopsis arginini]|uniref:Proline--tRNA ligase n=1 Tax=Mycoplasmopsis arginini TaxID=2094 RepID=A0AA43U2K4_MYCAR|nr:proline--tRNA ligase [Mycoplasmopsis arginini]MDI3350502.1 proline--tRNA ligase [Mycoplasmopsis arginini]MDI3351221.1 proline--tRNA ligase [Mycoplasmopsis arginini]MDI3352279.1 proline--tRNA ligase [Mycoplasmopsis arginini]